MIDGLTGSFKFTAQLVLTILVYNRRFDNFENKKRKF